MSLNPTDRYSTPRMLAVDVEHWLADEPVSAWPEPWTVKARRWMGRHRTLVTGTAAALVVGVAGLLTATALLTAANEKVQQANKHLLAEQVKVEEANKNLIAESNKVERTIKQLDEEKHNLTQAKQKLAEERNNVLKTAAALKRSLKKEKQARIEQKKAADEVA